MNKFSLSIFAIFCLGQSSAFAQSAGAGSCLLMANSQVCVDKTPCKTDSSGKQICLTGVSAPAKALIVPQTCWQYNYQYSCADQSLNVDTCKTAPWWDEKKCSQSVMTCANTTPETGRCTSYNITYSCEISPKVINKKMVCNSNLFDTSAFPTPQNKNGNFSKAALAMEIVRQSQVYANCTGAEEDCSNFKLFTGVSEKCTKGYFGLKNCCNASPGAQTNSQMMQIAMNNGASVVKFAGQSAVDAVSPYVFDAMYAGGEYLSGMASAAQSIQAVDFAMSATSGEILSTGTNFAANGVSLGAYGFTYSTGAFVEGAGMLGGAEGYLAFNPYVFAAMIAFHYLQEAIKCTQEEQVLGMHKGANLSVKVKDECTTQIPVIGTCIEYTESYCSFNSVLAKLINVQGKFLTGKNIEDCSGLSIKEIAGLDFTKIDLSEFAREMGVQAQKNMPSSSQINSAYTPIMQNATQGSAQNGYTGTSYPAGYKP